MTDHQAKYLEEAGQQLRRQGFTVCPEHVGLLSSGALFTPEQLAEMYRCIHETLDGPYPSPGSAICYAAERRHGSRASGMG